MPYRAIDVYRQAARTTDYVMVVVIHPALVAGGRTRRLDAADQALSGKGGEGVVHRLTRDRTDLSPHQLLDLVRRAVRPLTNRPQNSETLRRHLNTV